MIAEQPELPNLALERLHDQPERVPDNHPASPMSPGASKDEWEAAVADQVLSFGTSKAEPSSFPAPSLTDLGHPVAAYLKRWKAEVGVFFGGVSANSPEDHVRRIAPDHPVFRIEPAL